MFPEAINTIIIMYVLCYMVNGFLFQSIPSFERSEKSIFVL